MISLFCSIPGQVLLKHGADVNHRGAPLREAAENGHIAIMRQLIAAGRPNIKEGV